MSTTTVGGTVSSTIPAPPAPTTSVAAGPLPTCAAVPASLAGPALGLSLSDPVSTTNGSETLCTFNPVAGVSGPSMSTSVQFVRGISLPSFKEEMTQAGKDNTINSVTGLGDGAFSFTVQTASAGVTVLYFLAGGIQVGISSPASLSAEESLAQKLLPVV